VAMDEVKFALFGHTTGKYFLLTSGLNAYFLTIVSRTDGILGHIPPRPTKEEEDDLLLGDRNIVMRMREITSLVREHREHFANEKEVFVVSGI
jgi:hypothetical protein